MRIMSNRAGRIGRALLAFFLLATTVVVAPTSVGAQDNVLHDEAADGEISGDAANPLAVDLAVGANVLSGSVQAGNIDYVTVNVPDGYELSGIDLLSYTGPSVSFIGLQEGTQFTEPPNGTDVANLLGFHLFGGEVGSDILGAIGQGQGTQGFTGSLGAGDYTFWIQETGGEVDYSISLNVAEAPAAPSQVLFSVENLQPADGFFFTPVWAGLHNGDFDLFNSGERASAGLEVLAETGATGDLSAEFAQPGRLDTTIAGGPIAPGATVNGHIGIINPAAYRYVSFASMLIPSNDAFFGNGNPLAYELFDAEGNFNGPIVIDIYGEDIYDSGTEVNNASGAAGFSLGFDGQGQGPSTDDPTGTVGIHPDLLENIVGIQTAAGTTIGSDGSGFLDQDEPIARITIYVGEAPVFCAGHEVTVNLANGEVPTEGDDVIRGTSGDDEIMALGGNDIICGLQGDDTIYGGAGFDLVLAAAGNDTLVGGAGNDTLVGGPGQDTIMGQAGNDRLRGGDGADTIYGQGGGDLIRGGDGNDTIVGGFGNDELFGNLGRDNISGNQGDDILRGGAWIDRMNGGSGFDACTLTDPSGNVEVRTACERGVFGL